MDTELVKIRAADIRGQYNEEEEGDDGTSEFGDPEELDGGDPEFGEDDNGDGLM